LDGVPFLQKTILNLPARKEVRSQSMFKPTVKEARIGCDRWIATSSLEPNFQSPLTKGTPTLRETQRFSSNTRVRSPMACVRFLNLDGGIVVQVRFFRIAAIGWYALGPHSWALGGLPLSRSVSGKLVFGEPFLPKHRHSSTPDQSASQATGSTSNAGLFSRLTDG